MIIEFQKKKEMGKRPRRTPAEKARAQSSAIGGGSYCLLNILREIDKSMIEPVVCLASDGPLRKEIESLKISVVFFRKMVDIPYNKNLCISLADNRNQTRRLIQISLILKHPGNQAHPEGNIRLRHRHTVPWEDAGI